MTQSGTFRSAGLISLEAWGSRLGKCESDFTSPERVRHKCLKRFKNDQHDDAGGERQGSIVRMQRAEPEQRARGRPKKAEAQNRRDR